MRGNLHEDGYALMYVLSLACSYVAAATQMGVIDTVQANHSSVNCSYMLVAKKYYL